MTYVLDTNILIDVERGIPEIRSALQHLGTTLPCTTFMNKAEFYHGIRHKSKNNQERATALINRLRTLHTTDETVHLLNSLRITYASKGALLSLADLLIAALTIENNMILITRDQDFAHIKELKKVII